MSPLLRSALEVLEHGLWHFFRSDTVADMKFAIMHVDQAIELVMKEKVRAGGKSIYKNAKDAAFHVHNGVEFLRRFLKDELDVEIYDFVASEFLDRIFLPAEEQGDV